MFKTIGLISKNINNNFLNNTLIEIYYFLKKHHYEVFIEKTIFNYLNLVEEHTHNTLSIHAIGETCDLAIVVGGDGNMIGAARILSQYNIALLGVNRGTLGFLTDIEPDKCKKQILSILKGEFITEKRFLLEAQIINEKNTQSSSIAVNEIVLHPGRIAHMMQCEVYINNTFLSHYKGDGIIISTPTGSTAYSMSAGGAILTPNLNTIILVPMLPHSLSSRPIVLDADSHLKLIPYYQDKNFELSFDGHIVRNIEKDDIIIIKKLKNHFRLIHPKSYDYFQNLRSKLAWNINYTTANTDPKT